MMWGLYGRAFMSAFFNRATIYWGGLGDECLPAQKKKVIRKKEHTSHPTPSLNRTKSAIHPSVR